MSQAAPAVGNNLRRGFELACRLLAGEACDVVTLQSDLGISRATAYGYQRFLVDHATRIQAQNAPSKNQSLDT